MPLAEELEKLSGGGRANKKELNGWGSSHSCHSTPKRPRLISKDGSTLFGNLELPSKNKVAFRNWFHLAIEYQWRTIISVFFSGFFMTWILFAIIYFLITYYYRLDSTASHYRPCIMNVDDFVTALLFSLESQATIGYGHRYMTDMCPAAYTTLSVQVVVGQLLQTVLGGLVIAKILRPKKRKQEMRFSRQAVIGPLDEHDKRPALMIRLADIQEKLFLAESHVRLYMATSRTNEKGHRELVGVKDINVGYDSGWDRVLLLWPIVVRHVIDESSPFHGMTRLQLQSADFELIMTVEGIVEATGMTFQARTSFLPDEILWGHRFKPIVLLNEKRCKYEVHYALFDQTERFVCYYPCFIDIRRVRDFENNLAEAEETDEVDPTNASGFY